MKTELVKCDKCKREVVAGGAASENDEMHEIVLPVEAQPSGIRWRRSDLCGLCVRALVIWLVGGGQ